MLLDLLFPKYCLNCNRPGSYICDTCLPHITRHQQICIVCRKHAPYGKTHPYCQEHTSLYAVIIATEYKNIIKKTLVKIKYGMRYDIISELLDKTLISQKIQSFLASEQITYCTEIPMHQFKQNKRGFNQALLITQWIQKTYKIPHQSLIQKVSQTHAQMHLNRNDRLFNLTHSFELLPSQQLQDKTILLVDDVTTTSTTLEEAAILLKKAGAKKIIGLAIAGG